MTTFLLFSAAVFLRRHAGTPSRHRQLHPVHRPGVLSGEAAHGLNYAAIIGSQHDRLLAASVLPLDLFGRSANAGWRIAGRASILDNLAQYPRGTDIQHNATLLLYIPVCLNRSAYAEAWQFI